MKNFIVLLALVFGSFVSVAKACGTDWCGNSSSEEVTVSFVKAQVALLKSPDAEERLKAAKRLGEMGPDAMEAVNALLEVVNEDTDERVVEAAMDAVTLIDETITFGAFGECGHGNCEE